MTARKRCTFEIASAVRRRLCACADKGGGQAGILRKISRDITDSDDVRPFFLLYGSVLAPNASGPEFKTRCRQIFSCPLSLSQCSLKAVAAKPVL